MAVNITAGSLCSDEFRAWLTGYLTDHAELQERLLFEIPEAIMKHKDHVTALVKALQEHGFQWGWIIMDVTSSHWDIWKSWPQPMSRSTMATSQVMEPGRIPPSWQQCAAPLTMPESQPLRPGLKINIRLSCLPNCIDGYQGFVHPAFPLA